MPPATSPVVYHSPLDITRPIKAKPEDVAYLLIDQATLDGKIRFMPKPVFSEGRINVEETNRARVDYMLKNHLGPFLLVGGSDMFRKVDYAQELLTIEYVPVMPERWIGVSSTDSILYSMAATYLGFGLDQMGLFLDVMQEHSLRSQRNGIFYMVNLNGVNSVKPSMTRRRNEQTVYSRTV